ncbi:uncharacterized protein LOC126738543 [Anthonomus grandis grandis]|uniref:uncharacterized protein LOC126738543 n=1 Tax=Anthonomus grandis grandis TaxID=2921223 RepID=UPI002164F310|nr:uncharacterized protein LOC126738543 [Anthonomus grandis grandis]XP_050299876.1 uncharacterized protein LOC126738543 [Anthonomus grandis grandis]
MEKRQILMHSFRKIMYSESNEDLNEHMLKLQQEAEDCPTFWARFEIYFSRGQEWLYLHRKHLVIRGNNTNNYAEVIIKILKDIILHRTKGYNCVALVDFIAFVWEEYFKCKLLDFAHGRTNEIKNNYFKLCAKVNDFKPGDIVTLGDELYQISSSSNIFLKYIIDVPIGVCNYLAGINGSFCKHQAYLHKHLNIPFLNAPAINFQERASLGWLALGEKCPESKWFLALSEFSENAENIQDCGYQENHLETRIDAPFSLFDETIMEIDDTLEDDNKKEDVIEEIKEECKKFDKMLKEIPLKALERLANKLKRIQTAPQLYSFIDSKLSRVKCNSKIKVQPTTASRRRPGATRGSSIIPSGRPPCGKRSSQSVVKGSGKSSEK